MLRLSYHLPRTFSRRHNPRSLSKKVYRRLSAQNYQISNVLNGCFPFRYLLGSGGTLMFDITIVSQSFCYRPRLRRHSRALDEEETGLLSADMLSPHPPADSAIMNRGRTSHTPNRVHV